MDIYCTGNKDLALYAYSAIIGSICCGKSNDKNRKTAKELFMNHIRVAMWDSGVLIIKPEIYGGKKQISEGSNYA